MADPSAPPLADDSDTLTEYIAVEPLEGEYEIVETDDGGLEYHPFDEPEETPEPDPGDFYGNLAEVLADRAPQILDAMSARLLEKIEQDKEARKKRDEEYEEGMRRTGLGKDAPGGAEFEGASKAVHPGMAEACIDFEARVIKELMPSGGIVKPKIIGTATQAKVDRAKRKTEHMNWQITTQIKEARSVMETLLTQVPLAGRGYLHQRWDHRLGRARWEFVPADKAYYPHNAADWHSAHRRTVSWTLSGVELRERVDQGVYRDIKLGQASISPEQSKTEEASDKVEGKEQPSLNIDGDREILEATEMMEVSPEMAACFGVEEEGRLYPYIVSIDKQSRQILSIYRDWEEGDETREMIDHTFEFVFIYWRDGNVGFPHIIGTLSAAATGALRALLDSALIQNSATGVVLKGSGTGGQNRQPKIGELTEIDGGLDSDDIRKRVMPFPFQGPSPTLFQLLGFLSDAMKSTVRTSLDELAADQNPNTPVGTTFARMQEGMVVFSAIHGRTHAAFNRVLTGLHRLNRMYLPDELTVDDNGQEVMVYRQDYDGPTDVQPVSDPTIYSDAQRFEHLQYLQQRAMAVPGLYKQREIEKYGLELLKLPDIDRFLQDEPQPHELNAVNENLALAMGRPVIAFPDQDHMAHLQVLLQFMQTLGMNPLIGPVYLPKALEHAKEHILYYYVEVTTKIVEQAAGTEAHLLMSEDQAVKAKLDQLLALVSNFVIPRVMQQVQSAQAILQQAMQLAQQLAPKPPMDPAIQATVEATAAETNRKAKADQQDLAIAQQEDKTKRDIAAAANAAKLQQTALDVDSAQAIASAKIASGQSTGLQDGASFGGRG